MPGTPQTLLSFSIIILAGLFLPLIMFLGLLYAQHPAALLLSLEATFLTCPPTFPPIQTHTCVQTQTE